MLFSQVTLKRNTANLLFFLFVVAFLTSEFIVADVVFLSNGDRITGKIKKLNNGDLEIDPPYGENIFIIDWNEVERIESERNFIAQTSGGDYVTGSVRTDPDNSSQVLIEEEAQVLPVEQSELVYLKHVDEGFWGRLNASVDFGVSLTKANDTKQLNTISAENETYAVSIAILPFLTQDFTKVGFWA